MYDMGDVFLLIFVALIGWYWWSAQGVKDRALQAAKKHCKEMEVQLLDDSVALQRLWLRKDDRGVLRVWRRFHFEFTATGEERYQGSVELLGLSVDALQLAPHRIG